MIVHVPELPIHCPECQTEFEPIPNELVTGKYCYKCHIDFILTDSQTQKFDAGKSPMGLLSTAALTKIAEVLSFGAQKYSAHQWRSGIEWQRLLDAALRHLLAFNDGQDVDEETGLSHLAHLGCCVMFLLEFEETHPELDNRYKPEHY